MLQWYGALPPEQQAALQGLVVMALFAVVRAVSAWAGKPLSETAGAKFCNYLAVAVATAATTLLTTGAVPAFWWQWAIALWAAVGSWEGISKTYKPLKEATVAALFGNFALLLAVVLVVSLAAAPAMADRQPIEVSPVASLDGGPFLGAALSYPLFELDDYTLWLDAGGKQAAGAGNIFLGASTDAYRALDAIPLIKSLIPLLDRALPNNARVGGAYLFASEEWMFTLRVPITNF